MKRSQFQRALGPVALGAVLALLVAACGGDGSRGAQPAASGTPAATGTSVVTPRPGPSVSPTPAATQPPPGATPPAVPWVDQYRPGPEPARLPVVDTSWWRIVDLGGGLRLRAPADWLVEHSVDVLPPDRVRPGQVACWASMMAIRTRFRATAVRVAQSWFLALPI